MSQGKRNLSPIFKQLKNRYRLVVMNDSTFEEKFSLRLTPLGLIILVGSISVFMTAFVTSIIVFTPLREYIPGYGSEVKIRRQLIALTARTDSIAGTMDAKTLYIDNLKRVINGELSSDSLLNKPDPTKQNTVVNLKPSKEDSILRSQVELQEKRAIARNSDKMQNDINSLLFFSPLKGSVSSSFNIKQEHYGVDVTAPENEAVKATLDGTVIAAEWNVETGYTMQIQHSNNLISVYKHNATLMKKAGQTVKAGDVVAIVGNSGELTNGPHLHFELWYNGKAIDPQDYLTF